MRHKVVFIIGVSGSGKSTIGKSVAAATGYSFIDADDFHPQCNIEKMTKGIPLIDEDRLPWLYNINNYLLQHIEAGSHVVACSALKQQYREILEGGLDVEWFALTGNFKTIYNRMRARSGHFMSPELLQSQFDAWEECINCTEIDIAKPIRLITEEIVQKLHGKT